jgi:hypothetical protein
MHRWKNNIKIDIKETGGEDADWIHPAKDGEQRWAFVNMVMSCVC